MIMGGGLNPDEIDVVVIRGKISVTTKGSYRRQFAAWRRERRVDRDRGSDRSRGPVFALLQGRVPIPRFASDTSEAVTVIDVESSQTTLTAPYALADMGFDTGFAISNMTTNPGQAGAITFMLYQNGDEPVKYTTLSGSPGVGLTNGELEAGTTYRVLLTEILDAAGVEGGFSGYVTITTDFTGADGIAYISDWAAFSATATLK